MSLVRKAEMTEENRAAHRRNGRQSRGAATPEGKERSRAANLQHGYYSQERDEALRALGEDPGDLAALIAGAHEQFQPANRFQASMVETLAHLQWRIQRAARMQESLAAQHVARIEGDRRERTLAARYHHVSKEDFLSILRNDAARPDFYASPGYFREFCETFHDQMKGAAEEILELLHRLRKPRKFAPAPGPAPVEATSDEDWQEHLADMESDDFPIPQPGIPVAEGAERDELREELWERTAEWLRSLEEAWSQFAEKHGKPLSSVERDNLAADVNRQTELMRRQEDSCFRQFWRLGSFLMKIQDRAEERQDSGSRSQDLGVAGGGPKGPSPDGFAAKGGSRPTKAAQAAVRVLPQANPVNSNKNEGASGDVDENTGNRKFEVMTDCQVAAARGRGGAAPPSDDPAHMGQVPAGLGSRGASGGAKAGTK